MNSIRMTAAAGIMICIFCAGCGTPGTHTFEKSTLGAVLGAGAGTLVGAAYGRPAEGALAGALMGGAVGTAVGADLDQQAAVQAHAQAQAQQAQAIQGSMLTHNDIIALVQAKVSDEVIIAKINASAYVQQVNAEDIIAMKNRGVSDNVLNAMINKARTQPSVPAQIMAPAPPATAIYVDPWPMFWWEPVRPPLHHPKPPFHHPGPPPPPPPPPR